MLLNFFKNLFMDLYRQPLRTILTLSGVIWGTFSIVLLLAFGNGVKNNQMKTLHGMGESVIIVWPGQTTMSYKGFNKGKPVRVTPEDVLLLKQRIKSLKIASPEFISRKRIRYNKEEYNNSVRGINPEFEKMRNTIPQKGRFINIIDMKEKRKICFLGNTLSSDLFNKENPVGQQIFIEGVPFTVVGVMIEKVQDSTYSGGRDQYCAFIPYTTFSSLYGTKFVSNFVLQPWDPEGSKPVIQEVRNLLGEKIGFNPKDKDALFIWDFTDFEKSMNVFLSAFNIFLGIIGSFTLLVGGVGVASIMLVVVEERIKEIGIKLAVGAKRRQILFQFFFEALTIILMGGLIGFSFALILLNALPMDKIDDYVGVPQVNPLVGIITILILLCIGTISGVMPAKRAASTNPIEALRS
jgi:putative ABC transport system permease protein